MRRGLLPASFLLLVGLAGCAHQSAGGGGGYAGMAFADCEYSEDCYGPDTSPYTCVFVQAPSVPARLAITAPAHRHPSPRVVHRGDWGAPSGDSFGGAGTSASAAPPPPPPAPAREPVVLVSPGGGGRTPR